MDDSDSMNDGSPELPGDMRLELRLSHESGGRIVKVRVQRDVRAREAWEEVGIHRYPHEVMPVFVAAVDVELFHGPKEGQRAEILNGGAKTEGAERTDEWEIATPPLEVEAFLSLSRMFWALEARTLEITQNAPADRLTVRTFDQVPKSTARIPSWRVEKTMEDEAKDAVVLVAFEKNAAPEVVRDTHAVLRAWGELATFGGLPGATCATSAAVLSELGTELRSEVFATFEALYVGRDGWAALWAGLSRIHKHAPIARVEMR